MKKIFILVLSIVLLMVIFNNSYATKTKEKIDEKENAVEASIDIGDNFTQLLEKLAKQIGTTTDQIFTWYVKQQIIEGYVFFIMIGIISFICLSIFFYSFKKAGFTEDSANIYSLFLIITGIIMALTFTTFIFGMSDAISKIINPNFHTIKAITYDLSRLVK